MVFANRSPSSFPAWEAERTVRRVASGQLWAHVPSLRQAISPENDQCSHVPVRRPALRARLQLSYTNQRRVIHGVLTTLDHKKTPKRARTATPSAAPK